MSTPTYEVLTWDTDRQKFTPQQSVRRGPYSLMGLRKALRKLRNVGYTTLRKDGNSVLIQKR